MPTLFWPCNKERARARYILASTSALPPKSRKIIKNKSQSATPEHRTLQLSNFAGCDSDMSHLATLPCCTLQLSHVAPCNIAPSHLATSTCRTLRLEKPPSGAQSRPFSRHLRRFRRARQTPETASRNALQPLPMRVRRIPTLKEWVNSSPPLSTLLEFTHF